MKQKMTFYELKRYIEENPPEEICFLTENQKWYNPFEDSIKVDLSFSEMLFYSEAKEIFLREGKNKVMLFGVYSSFLDTETYLPLTALTLICNIYSNPPRKKKIELVLK